MSIFKRTLCLLLASSLLSLGACTDGGVDESKDSASAPSESVADVSKDASQWVEELDIVNNKYKGKVFGIISCDNGLFFDDSETPVAKELMSRNALIEQKLGVAINCEEKTASDIEKELRQAIADGKPYANLICAPADVLARLAADGLLENLYSLPYLDLDAGYVNKDEVAAQTVSNTMYMMSGRFTMDIGATYGLFFNKELLSGIGVDPYSMVNSGNWTWSALSEAATVVSGNGVYGIDSLISETETLSAIYASCGGKLVESGAGKDATIAFDDSIATYASSLITNLFRNGDVGGNYTDNEAVKAFNNNKLAFIVARLDNVALFDDAEKEWGLVPLPKGSASQTNYVSPVSGAALAFAVPKGCEDSAFSGFMLNALLAASTDRLDKALKLTYINYHFWSNDAALMLERIGKTKATDIGVVYSSVEEVYAVAIEMLLKTDITTVPTEKADVFYAFADKLFN